MRSSLKWEMTNLVRQFGGEYKQKSQVALKYFHFKVIFYLIPLYKCQLSYPGILHAVPSA